MDNDELVQLEIEKIENELGDEHISRLVRCLISDSPRAVDELMQLHNEVKFILYTAYARDESKMLCSVNVGNRISFGMTYQALSRRLFQVISNLTVHFVLQFFLNLFFIRIIVIS